MAAAEEGDQQFLDDLVLADDDAGQLLLDVVEGVAQLADRFEVAFGEGGAGIGRLSVMEYLVTSLSDACRQLISSARVSSGDR